MSTFDSLLPHCTVFLNGLIENRPVSSGTGFYYFFNDTFSDEDGNINELGTARIGIVTNKHVVNGIEKIKYFFNSSVEGVPGYEAQEVSVSLNTNSVIFHPNPNIDLCVILADSLMESIHSTGRKLHLYPVRKNNRRTDEQLKEMETIQNLIMIGYPRGIWDSVNNLPIIRSGINATPIYANYQGEPNFAVDIALYPGSSGSPVFIYDKGFYLEGNNFTLGNRLSFVGVISSGHTTNHRLESGSIQEMLHIGIAIKVSELDVFEELILRHYEG